MSTTRPGNSGAAIAFARRLRNWRQQTGLPLKHLAADIGVSVSTLSQWETGHRFPSIRNLERLAKHMRMRPCCLLYEGKGDCPHCPCQG